MIFIIPIILGAAAILTGGLGVAAGAEGLSNIIEKLPTLKIWKGFSREFKSGFWSYAIWLMS